MAQATSFMDVSKELRIPSNELKCNGFQHGDMFAVKVDKKWHRGIKVSSVLHNSLGTQFLCMLIDRGDTIDLFRYVIDFTPPFIMSNSQKCLF